MTAWTTILLIVVLIISGVVICNHLFYSSFIRRAEQVRNEAGNYDGKITTEADLAYLPPAVIKYLVRSGVTGRKRINSSYIKHSGLFRPGADKKFIPIKGEYFLTTRRPSFCWFGTIQIFPGINISAFDSYFNGNGRMLIKFMSFFKIADSRSPETSLSALGRCIAEMTMAPSFFMNEQVEWLSFDSDRATCRITDSGLKVEAKLYFQSSGALDRIEVERPFDRGNGAFTVELFTAKGCAIRDFNGLKMASVLDGYWNLTEGDLHYVHFTMDEMNFE
jgi:hypothetical protein